MYRTAVRQYYNKRADHFSQLILILIPTFLNQESINLALPS